MAGDPLLDYSPEDTHIQGAANTTQQETAPPNPTLQKNDQIVVYEDDLVMIQDKKNPEQIKIGLVDYIADEDSDVEEDFVPSGHMRVLWLGEQYHQTVPLSSVKVIDRATVAGDVVSLRENPLGQKGQVIGQDLRLDIRYLDGSEMCDISSVQLQHLHPVSIGAVVLHEGWVGRVEDTMFNIVVQFDEGQIARIPSNLVVHDVVKLKNLEALSVRDGVPIFYPGVNITVDLKQTLSAEERREVTWLQGRQRLFGSGKVLSVEPTMLEVDWLAFAMGIDMEARRPPTAQVKIDQVTKIMDYNQCYRWELGDYGYFTAPAPQPPHHPEHNQEIQQITHTKDQTQNFQQSPGQKIGVRLPKHKNNRVAAGFGRGFRRGQTNPLEQVVNRMHEVVRITRTRQLVDVLWQDGTISRNIPSVDLLLPEYLSDQDLFPGDYIQEKLDQGDEPSPGKKLGVIVKLDAKACTLKVRWLQRQQNNHAENATSQNNRVQQNFGSDPEGVQIQTNQHDDNQLTRNDGTDKEFCISNVHQTFQQDAVSQNLINSQTNETQNFAHENLTMKFLEEEVSVYEIQEHQEFAFNWGDIISNIHAKPETDMLQRTGQVVGGQDGKVKIQWADGTKGLMFPDEIVMLSPEEGYPVDEDDDEQYAEIVSNDDSSWATNEEFSENGENITHEENEHVEQSEQQSFSDGQKFLEFKGIGGNLVSVPIEFVDRFVSQFQSQFEEFVSQQSEESKAHLSSDNFQIWVRKVAHEICSCLEPQSNFPKHPENVFNKARVGSVQTQELMNQFLAIHREQLMSTLLKFADEVRTLIIQQAPYTVPRFWWPRKNANNAQNANNALGQENTRKGNGFRNVFNWFGKRQRSSLPILTEEQSQEKKQTSCKLTSFEQLPDIMFESTSGQSSAHDKTPLTSPSSLPQEDALHAENDDLDLGDVQHADQDVQDMEIDEIEEQKFQDGDALGFFATNVSMSDGVQKSNQFKQFDIDATCPIDHFYISSKSENGIASDDRQRMKRLQREWGMMQDGLPPSIWVRTYEDRTDVLRAAIAGADDTPYHDGLFFFDVYLSPDFPFVPPKIHYVSYGMKPNPNLYETGHVCLSLVNTWDGKTEERWNPKDSSLLQLFVSIQGLVLVSKPYFNEAGFDSFIGQPEFEKNAKLYNEQAFIMNCKSMLNQMRNPPIGFENLVGQHFVDKKDRILKWIDYYVEPSSSVEYSTGLVLAANKDLKEEMRVDWTTSLGFRKLLEKLRPKLQAAFSNLDQMDVQQ